MKMDRNRIEMDMEMVISNEKYEENESRKKTFVHKYESIKQFIEIQSTLRTILTFSQLLFWRCIFFFFLLLVRTFLTSISELTRCDAFQIFLINNIACLLTLSFSYSFIRPFTIFGFVCKSIHQRMCVIESTSLPKWNSEVKWCASVQKSFGLFRRWDEKERKNTHTHMTRRIRVQYWIFGGKL